MKELYVFCEGRTEQLFCKQVLAPHLFPGGGGCIYTIKIANSKSRGVTHRGGIGKYRSLKRDIQIELKRRPQRGIYFTSLIDLYGLPNDFPGKASNLRNPTNPTPFVLALEWAFAADIADNRFIPHLQLHEFETMLLVDPDSFQIAFENRGREIAQLKALVSSFTSVEQINDGRNMLPRSESSTSFRTMIGERRSSDPTSLNTSDWRRSGSIAITWMNGSTG